MRKGNELTVIGVYIGTDDDSTDASLSYHVSYEEVVRLVKASRGRKFFLHCDQFAPYKDESKNTQTVTLGRQIQGLIMAPRSSILQFLERAYYKQARELVYVRITFSSRCFFIG